MNQHGFELTHSKWAVIAKCSQDTALRDFKELLERKILIRSERVGGVRIMKINQQRLMSFYSIKQGLNEVVAHAKYQ